MNIIRVPVKGLVTCGFQSRAVGRCNGFTGVKVDCALNISTNMPLSMDEIVVADFSDGNFSKVISLIGRTSIVVSGLTSCGAVIVTDMLCKQAAAGHVSGDLHMVEKWCTLIRARRSFHARYLVVGCGKCGSMSNAKDVAKEYEEALGIDTKNTFLFEGCGAVGVTRAGVAFAQCDSMWG